MKSKLSVILFCLMLVLVESGCSPMRYSLYTGKGGMSQTGIFPQGQGTMAETSYAIPVYRGWPERRYKVLGSIRFVEPNKSWDDGVIQMAARSGKQHGGDAIIIRQGSEWGVGKITGAVNDPIVFSSNEMAAFVIKWFSEAEDRVQDERNRDFVRKFSAEHPDVRSNQEVSELIIRFLLQSGLDASSEELRSRFTETMLKVTPSQGGGLSGSWFMKGNLTTSSLTGTADVGGFLGTATLSLDGENVAIVSDSGKVEVNFNGTLNKGRLSGQVGIGQFSVKCEGAALPNKISLSFQSATADGVVRGNIAFQRLQKSTQNEK